jgi:hypothetical protein
VIGHPTSSMLPSSSTKLLRIQMSIEAHQLNRINIRDT